MLFCTIPLSPGSVYSAAKREFTISLTLSLICVCVYTLHFPLESLRDSANPNHFICRIILFRDKKELYKTEEYLSIF